MAAIDGTRTNSGDGSVITFAFATLTTTNDRGSPIPFAEWADRSVQASGTWGVGGALRWEGSNDGVTYTTLTDAGTSSATALTANGLVGIVEITKFARPFIYGGDGTTDIDVTVLCRRQSGMRT